MGKPKGQKVGFGQLSSFRCLQGLVILRLHRLQLLPEVVLEDASDTHHGLVTHGAVFLWGGALFGVGI